MKRRFQSTVISLPLPLLILLSSCGGKPADPMTIPGSETQASESEGTPASSKETESEAAESEPEPLRLDLGGNRV